MDHRFVLSNQTKSISLVLIVQISARDNASAFVFSFPLTYDRILLFIYQFVNKVLKRRINAFYIEIYNYNNVEINFFDIIETFFLL